MGKAHFWELFCLPTWGPPPCCFASTHCSKNYVWKLVPTCPYASCFKFHIKWSLSAHPQPSRSALHLRSLESLLIMPELILIACDKWELSTGPSTIRNEIKVKWSVSMFCLSNQEEDRSSLKYWWTDYFPPLAYQALLPQRFPPKNDKCLLLVEALSTRYLNLKS